MFINQFPTAYYASIMHIGLGGNIRLYGDRNPGFWVSNGGVLHVASSISGNRNRYTNNMVEKNKWISLKVSQTLRDGKVLKETCLKLIYDFFLQYMFEVYIDGVKEHSMENSKPVILRAVKVFAGDKFYAPLDGKIRNIYIQSKKN